MQPGLPGSVFADAGYIQRASCTGVLTLACVVTCCQEMVFGVVATILTLSASLNTLQRIRGRNAGYEVLEKGYYAKVFASVSWGQSDEVQQNTLFPRQYLSKRILYAVFISQCRALQMPLPKP